MSRDIGRKNFYDNRDRRGRDWGRNDYRNRPPPPPRNRSRSPERRRDRERDDKRRSRSPRRSDNKDVIDDNILREISKLPEPSELWDGNQFGQDGGFPPAQAAPAPPAPDYPLEGYRSNYPPSYSNPNAMYPPPLQESSNWNQMSLPPPPPSMQPMQQQQPQQPLSSEDQMKKEAAIESEMRHQKAALSKQREDYMKKANILKKELETLKDQRNELRGDPKRSPSPDTKRFLKENTKLQLEIQNKLKTITNVVDMLNGIIGEGAQHVEATRDSDESPERSSSKRRSRSEDDKKFNYVYYDPEMHWCRVCNEFPPTAKDYLNHLHSASHNKMAAQHMEAPWHSVSGVNEGFPSFPSAPTKRTPIRGLQFFVPSTAWYCKLCDQFIGDLHCASAHLKSVQHSNNYTNFVEQNPHWETDWMSDRQRAFEKARSTVKAKPEDKPAAYSAHTITYDKDGFHTTRRKPSPPPEAPDKKKKEKKKKAKKSKRESSSSSSSSSSDSDSKSKRRAKSKKRSAETAALQEWMAAMQRDETRKMLHDIHNMKEKQEKRRSPERDRSERERPSESSRNRERERERDRERSPSRRRERASPKKPEIRKMPFIGKMPIYKNLSKKTEEEKKKEEEVKKKEDEQESSKRKQEMDAEIQKKVAEFKEKIAKAQLERQHEHAPPLPPHLAHHAPPLPAAPPAALPQDFQDALDIIFPPEVKQHAAQIAADPEFIAAMQAAPPPFPRAPGAGLLPNPFLPPALPQMPPMAAMPQMPQMPQMQQMQQMPLVGFDLNAQLFPRAQISIFPKRQNQQNNGKNRQNQNRKNQNQNSNRTQNRNESAAESKTNGQEAARKREELDDLAMLGIDASDVGAGI